MSKLKKKAAIEPQELTEDIEVIGPGQILTEGRKAMGLSQDDVAEKLNFRLTLVRDIENEKFDKSLPDTFNRGYLRNFAKLVNVSVDDVLASYELLDVAEKQGAEMQSFSKITKKQTENSILKWLTYFIVALIFGSFFVWFVQESSSPLAEAEQTKANVSSETTANELEKSSVENTEIANSAPSSVLPSNTSPNNTSPSNTSPSNADINNSDTSDSNTVNETQVSDEQSIDILPTAKTQLPELTQLAGNSLIETSAAINDSAATSPDDAIAQTTEVIFTFSGDCWVNIYDATGERIAWGVKKTDYVMTIKGVAPFSVTLGKPELVAIEFDGNNIDMNQFNRGNIAKFSLPLAN